MPRLLMVAAAAVFLAAGSLPADAQVVEGARTTREYLELGTRHFQDMLPNFERETVRGTGYKPFMRYKAFMEPRLGSDDDLPVGARWNAYQRLQDLYEEQGRGGFPTWFQLGPTNVAGRCLAIDVHPSDYDIAYAGFAAGGIWKTVDGGATWTVLGDDLPSMAVGTIEIDVTNPDRIWIGTGEGWGNIDAVHGVGVLVSTDAGVTWGTTGYTATFLEARDVYEIEYNPTTGTLLVAADNGMWRSTDGGVNFTQQMTGGQWKDVELKAGTTQTYYACMHGAANPGFYTSTDDGLTWNRSTTGTPTSSIGNCRLAQSGAEPESVWWLVANSGTGTTLGLYKSTDGGASFSTLTSQNFFASFGQGWYDLTLAVAPTNGNIIFAGGVEFWRSTNGGASFSTTAGNVHVDHHASIWAPSDVNVFWVGTDGGGIPQHQRRRVLRLPQQRTGDLAVLRHGQLLGRSQPRVRRNPGQRHLAVLWNLHLRRRTRRRRIRMRAWASGRKLHSGRVLQRQPPTLSQWWVHLAQLQYGHHGQRSMADPDAHGLHEREHHLDGPHPTHLSVDQSRGILDAHVYRKPSAPEGVRSTSPSTTRIAWSPPREPKSMSPTTTA